MASWVHILKVQEATKKSIEISTAGFSRNRMVNGDGYYVGS